MSGYDFLEFREIGVISDNEWNTSIVISFLSVCECGVSRDKFGF